MHDVHTIEREGGLPSVALVSSTFASQAIYQAKALGVASPERHIVLAAHPISDATTDELAAKADALYADLLDELVAGKKEEKAPRSFRGRRVLPKEDEMMSAECAAGA